MRGCAIRYKKLGELLESARVRAGLSRDDAAAMLGLSGRNFICNAEHGKVNFPMRKLKRALEIYNLKPERAIEAIVEDDVTGLKLFLKGNK